MAIVQDTMKAQIRFSTQIIKRLGEELNPSVDQSILELVKNAYDADAKKCVVELDNITDVGGAIKITDDGIGMNAKDIIDGWLVLGESSKSIHKKNIIGKNSRRKQGTGKISSTSNGSCCRTSKHFQKR